MAIFVWDSVEFRSQLAQDTRPLRLLKTIYDTKRSWDKESEIVNVRPKRVVSTRFPQGLSSSFSVSLGRRARPVAVNFVKGHEWVQFDRKNHPPPGGFLCWVFSKPRTRRKRTTPEEQPPINFGGLFCRGCPLPPCSSSSSSSG